MFWNDGEGDALWLGRAMNNPEWETSSLIGGQRDPVRVFTKTQRGVGAGKVTIKKGDAAVLMRWYKRVGEGETEVGAEELQYVVSEHTPIVQNTKYVVHWGIDKNMCQVSGKASMVR